MKRHIFKKQSGRSMVEMLGVLAIIGVLSVGAIAGYNMAIEKHRLNEAIEAVQLIVAETRNMYASQGNYNGLGHAVSKGPADGDSVAARILERLNINTYYPIMIDDTNGIFTVAVIVTSESNCIKMNTMDWSGYGSDFAGLYSYDSEGKSIIVKKMSVSEAQNLCKEMMDRGGYGGIELNFNPTRD